MSTTTPWPAPLSPRDYDHLLAADRTLAAQYAEERQRGLEEYARRQAQSVPPEPPKETWKPEDIPGARRWSVVRNWKQAGASKPRHSRPITHWWTRVDAAIKAFADRQHREVLLWIALNKPETRRPAAAPTRMAAEPDHSLSWTAFPTAEWPGVVGQWTREEFAARTGAQR